MALPADSVPRRWPLLVLILSLCVGLPVEAQEDVSAANRQALEAELRPQLSLVEAVSFGTPTSTHKLKDGFDQKASINSDCSAVEFVGLTTEGEQLRTALSGPVRIAHEDTWVIVHGDQLAGGTAPLARASASSVLQPRARVMLKVAVPNDAFQIATLLEKWAAGCAPTEALLSRTAVVVIAADVDARLTINGKDLGTLAARTPRAWRVALGEQIISVRSASQNVEEKRVIDAKAGQQANVVFTLAAKAEAAAAAVQAQSLATARARFERALNMRSAGWVREAQNELAFLRASSGATPADELRLQASLRGILVTVTLVNFEDDARVDFTWQGQKHRLEGSRTRAGDEVKIQMPFGRNQLQLTLRNSHYGTNRECNVVIDVIDDDEFYNQYQIETDRGCRFKKTRER